jgi:hypothetical protein
MKEKVYATECRDRDDPICHIDVAAAVIVPRQPVFVNLASL